MQTMISEPLPGKSKAAPFIFEMLPVALSNVPFHYNTESITRYFAEKFPVHLAVLEVSPVLTPPEEYTLPHLHDDCHEINIILSTQHLLYKIQYQEDEYTVSSNACIWIPKGTIHAANVLEGAGYFITMRMD